MPLTVISFVFSFTVSINCRHLFLFYDAFKLIVIKSLNIFCCCYSEDSNAKYEVYVPDGRGDMAQQLLTLPEIRTLLARQADSPADSDIISLEGGKVSLILELFY